MSSASAPSGLGLEGAVVLVLIGLVNSSAAAVDAALIASVLGILATMALARILTKGRR